MLSVDGCQLTRNAGKVKEEDDESKLKGVHNYKQGTASVVYDFISPATN